MQISSLTEVLEEYPSKPATEIEIYHSTDMFASLTNKSISICRFLFSLWLILKSGNSE